jgi:deazaflavin-dependent oxidoreductase (nitroreductase family)
MKHRIVHFLQKYLFNPPVKLLFAIGLVPPGYAFLETTGRKTGKPPRTPAGNGLVGKQFWIVAEHGQKAGYVRNIVGNPRVPEPARWATGSLLHRDSFP